MYLSRLRLNPLSRDVARDIGDVAQLHRTVMRAFPSAPNGESARAHYKVLHRLEADQSRGTVTLYVQAQSAPNWDFLPDGYIIEQDDSALGVKPVDELYEAIAAGRRLRFRLRANVTRKIDTKTGSDGVRRHGRRVPLYGEKEQIEWLRRQGERNGFQVASISTLVSGSAELYRSRSTGRTFQGVLYEGTLMVLDADAFRRALVDGIGPAKAFGFGLLSVAPE